MEGVLLPPALKKLTLKILHWSVKNVPDGSFIEIAHRLVRF